MAEPLAMPFIDLKAQQARIHEGVNAAIARVLEHGRYILGPEVGELEQAMASYCGADHCVTCANGTDALSLVLMAEGIGTGDVVLVPSFTFCATAEAVAQVGATPFFVDVEEATYNIDPQSVSAAIDEARKANLNLRAIIAVDLFGLPADYRALRQVAESAGLLLIADAAQSFGARRDDARVGVMADYTTTSFFPAKPLGCYGDGGAIFTDSSQRAERLRSLRAHGAGDSKYDHVAIGLNSRLDTIQAAVVLEKLKIFDDEIAARQAAATRYRSALEGLAGTPAQPDKATSVWAQYTIRLSEGLTRDQVRASCADQAVPTAVYYAKPLHQQKAYAHYPRCQAGLACSETLARSVLSLPMHAYIDQTAQDRVCTALREGLSNSLNNVCEAG